MILLFSAAASMTACMGPADPNAKKQDEGQKQSSGEKTEAEWKKIKTFAQSLTQAALYSDANLSVDTFAQSRTAILKFQYINFDSIDQNGEPRTSSWFQGGSFPTSQTSATLSSSATVAQALGIYTAPQTGFKGTIACGDTACTSAQITLNHTDGAMGGTAKINFTRGKTVTVGQIGVLSSPAKAGFDNSFKDFRNQLMSMKNASYQLLEVENGTQFFSVRLNDTASNAMTVISGRLGEKQPISVNYSSGSFATYMGNTLGSVSWNKSQKILTIWIESGGTVAAGYEGQKAGLSINLNSP